MPMPLLEGSVGQGGINKAGDTRVVQRLLNDGLVNTGGVLLNVDGLVGPKTIMAIRAFQQRHLSVVDGRVDPDGRTIAALFDRHLDGLLQMIDLSKLSSSVDANAAKRGALTDPMVAGLIQQYIKALRSHA